MIWKIKNLYEHCASNQTEINGVWIPSRPVNIRTFKEKFFEAFMVFIGKYDCLKWDGDQ